MYALAVQSFYTYCHGYSTLPLAPYIQQNARRIASASVFEWLKLTDKPRSFHREWSGQSFILPRHIAKRPPDCSCGRFTEWLKLTDKPGSVVDSHSSRPAIAHWLKQPTRVQYGPYLVNPYLALLRVEFTVPRTVTSRAVRSYRTLSPLPDPTCVGHRRFALCCTGRGFPPQALPGTLPYGARTFLPSARLPRRRTTTKRRLSGQLRRAV